MTVQSAKHLRIAPQDLCEDVVVCGDPARAKRIASSCHEQGVIVLTAGTHGNVVRLLPPLVLAEGLLDEGLDALDTAVRV